MYDAYDGDAPASALSAGARKRLDGRRNTKPKKPDAQHLVCTPFDESQFHFGKIRDARERLLSLELYGARYHVLTNKYPLFCGHMLLVADALLPQQMTSTHLLAVLDVVRSAGHCAYFNSWCASASVNHFHCHLIDEHPPVTALPLIAGPVIAGVGCQVPSPDGYTGHCYVFDAAAARGVAAVDEVVRAMQAENQPHNLLFTPSHVYLWPKPLERPSRSLELYPETVGGPELLGSFTVYTPELYESLEVGHAEELVCINTAPLPPHLLTQGDAPAPRRAGRHGVHRMRAASTWVGHRRRDAGGGV